ncbi:MAG TPA: hypothetical protein VJO14_05370 [Bacteroidota bacterium]|nr:hypothetical protein [Bacteroidota bacterium]
MIVTVLAIACIALLGILTVAGYRMIIRGGESPAQVEGTEKCAICRQSVRTEEMVERLIGDHRVLYFCGPCITGLASDFRDRGVPGVEKLTP